MCYFFTCSKHERGTNSSSNPQVKKYPNTPKSHSNMCAKWQSVKRLYDGVPCALHCGVKSARHGMNCTLLCPLWFPVCLQLACLCLWIMFDPCMHGNGLHPVWFFSFAGWLRLLLDWTMTMTGVAFIMACGTCLLVLHFIAYSIPRYRNQEQKKRNKF